MATPTTPIETRKSPLLVAAALYHCPLAPVAAAFWRRVGCPSRESVGICAASTGRIVHGLTPWLLCSTSASNSWLTAAGSSGANARSATNQLLRRLPPLPLVFCVF